MLVFKKSTNTQGKMGKVFIFSALIALALFTLILAAPASGQSTSISIDLDQNPQTADFTVKSDITISLSGNVTISTESATTTVYFGIHAPDGWEAYLSLDEETVYLGTTILDFQGEVRPSTNSEQKEHDVYIWASAESRDYNGIDWGSSPTSSERIGYPIDIIINRVKLITGGLKETTLPDSTIVHSFTVTNVGTVSDIFFIRILNDEQLKDEGWVITQSAENLSLAPQETKTFYVEEHIPQDAPVGDYQVEVLVSSQGHAGSTSSQSMVTKVRLPKIQEPFEIDWLMIISVGFVGTGIGLAAFFAATEIGYLSLLSLFLPLYVRLKKKDVLSHFTRGQIFGYIQANPGAHYNAIIQYLGLHNGVGAYHLQVLEREGYIKSLRDGIYKRFYPKNMRIPEKRLHLSRIQRDILQEIQKHPGVSQKQVSKLLDESKQVVNYNVKILESAQLIRVERIGRETACFAGSVKYIPDEDIFEVTDEKSSQHVMQI
ncbi:MAG: winged helix-turn-helix transcriptional regulator [Methanomassiliicoccales archaeon]|nr:MAG: winged helix-turn-helix transcriptional regulator [Methanomassiliicoccales archaeon]